MKLVFSENPPPAVGQLLYREFTDDNGNFRSASLAFVDGEIEAGKQWLYTEIALMEDTGNGLEVYTGIESGGMPPKYTRLATDEDLLKFIRLIKDGKATGEARDIGAWIEAVCADTVLLPAEKERISRLSALV